MDHAERGVNATACESCARDAVDDPEAESAGGAGDACVSSGATEELRGVLRVSVIVEDFLDDANDEDDELLKSPFVMPSPSAAVGVAGRIGCGVQL